MPDVIHPSGPLYLVVCLELLRNTFACCHLFYQPREHFFCLTVNVGKTYALSSNGRKLTIKGREVDTTRLEIYLVSVLMK